MGVADDFPKTLVRVEAAFEEHNRLSEDWWDPGQTELFALKIVDDWAPEGKTDEEIAEAVPRLNGEGRTPQKLVLRTHDALAQLDFLAQQGNEVPLAEDPAPEPRIASSSRVFKAKSAFQDRMQSLVGDLLGHDGLSQIPQWMWTTLEVRAILDENFWDRAQHFIQFCHRNAYTAGGAIRALVEIEESRKGGYSY